MLRIGSLVKSVSCLAVVIGRGDHFSTPKGLNTVETYTSGLH